jgi:hypothetical protein
VGSTATAIEGITRTAFMAMAQLETWDCFPKTSDLQVVGSHLGDLPFVAAAWVLLFAGQICTLRGRRFNVHHVTAFGVVTLLLVFDFGGTRYAFFEFLPSIWNEPSIKGVFECVAVGGASFDGPDDALGEISIALFFVSPLVLGFMITMAIDFISPLQPDADDY